jgi:outer membrane lipoprotein-sorting protein
MPKLFSTVTLMILSLSLVAQSNDPAAKKVLDDVSAKFKTYKTVQAGFSYKVEDANGKVMSTRRAPSG